MKPFKLTILGSNSAVPAFNRYPTAQILALNNAKYMIDCGEGAQFQLSKFNIKRSGLNHIFISHLHGDHYLGLVGLLSTLKLNSRKENLHVYGPAYLKKIIDVQLDYDARKDTGFEIIFHALEFGKSEKSMEDEQIEVYTIPLDHKVECNGFLFKEKEGSRKIIFEKIQEYNIPTHKIKAIKLGADFVAEDGTVIDNNILTAEPSKPRSYAYCSDTKYSESIIPIIKEANLLYHESTFMHDLQIIAAERYHSTSIEAAKIAKLANVKKLAIGHFSARYRNLEPMLAEAKTVFENTELGIEGTVFEIG